MRHLNLLRAAVITVIVAALAVSIAEQIRKGNGDPILWLNTGRIFLAQTRDIYLSPIPPHNNYFYYPPFFAVLCIPLQIFPENAVIVAWAIASLVLLAWSIAAFLRLMAGRPFLS